MAIVAFAVLALAALGGCAGRGKGAPDVAAQPAAPAPVPASVDEAVRGVLEQYRQAYEVRSLDALLPLYLQSADLVLVRQGRPVLGWEAARQSFSSLLTQASEIRIELEPVRVVPLGADGAVVTARLARTVSHGPTSVREEGTLTLVLRRDAGGWVIAGEHFSHPPRT